MRGMNFTSLDYFAALAREKNFTRAAERLHITQQSLSAHIAGLEREFGCRLVERSVPLELTYAGRTFLRYAEEIGEMRLSLQRELGDIAENQKGELRVGVAFTRGRAIMPQLITAFQECCPSVEVTLREGSNEQLEKLLLEGEIDLAAADFSKASPEIELRDFYQEKVVLCMAKTLLRRCGTDLAARREELAAGDLSALRDCPFVLGSAENIGGRIGRELLRRAGIRPIVRATSGNIETVLALCERGVGACFSPENLVHTALLPQQLEEICLFHLGDAAAYPISFGLLKRTRRWHVAEEFVRIACAMYGE